MQRKFKRRTIGLVVLIMALLVVDTVVLWRRGRYADEAERLRASMTELDRQRVDAIVGAEQDEARLMLELMRRQAAGDQELHLAVNVDSSQVTLDRGGARLRTIPAKLGLEKRVGTPPDTIHVVVPRGKRTVERLLGDSDTYEFPLWVWTERSLSVPAARSAKGWTGKFAIVTTGGTLIYSLPKNGPLSDSTFVMPGTVRVSATDLAAVRESLSRGMAVYFY